MLITVQADHLSDLWPTGVPIPAAPELRAFCNMQFVTPDGVMVQPQPNFYLPIPCTYNASTGQLNYSQFQIQSTTDGFPNTATYAFKLYTRSGPAGQPICDIAGLQNTVIQTSPTVTTLPAIQISNTSGLSPVYSIDFALQQIVAGFYARVTIPDGETLPSVLNHYSFITSNSTPTNITNFVRGYAGQVIYVFIGDNHTKIFGNSYAQGTWLTFGFDGTNWTAQVPFIAAGINSINGDITSAQVVQGDATSGPTVSSVAGTTSITNPVADGSHYGVLSTLAQNIAGAKTFLNQVVVNSNDATLLALGPNGGTHPALQVLGGSSVVNGLSIFANPTGVAPGIAAIGPDTDINLLLTTKGAGYFDLVTGAGANLFWGNPAKILTLSASGGGCGFDAGTGGQYIFRGSSSGSATLKAQASAGTYTFLLPNTDPTVGQNVYVAAFSGGTVTLAYQTAGGGGSGTVNAGTSGQLAYYASNGTAVSGLNTPLTVPFGGTGLASITAGQLLYGAGTSALGNSANLTYSAGQLLVGNNGSITVPYSTGHGITPSTETHGATITLGNDQTFVSTDVFAGATGGAIGTASIANLSDIVTINSGAYVFTTADIGKSFVVYTGPGFGAPFFSSTIASIIDTTHFHLALPSNITLTAQPYTLYNFVNNRYTSVFGDNAGAGGSGSTVMGFGAVATDGSQYGNNGFSGLPYGGYPTIFGAMAGKNQDGTTGSALGTSVGSFTQTGTNESVAMGPSSKAFGLACFAYGDKAEAMPTGGSGSETIIGDACRATGYQNILMTAGGAYRHDTVIAFCWTSNIGNVVSGNTASFANNQLLVGGVNLITPSASGIRECWFGNGDVITNGGWTNSTPFNTGFNVTGGAGSNIAGADHILRGGTSTGNAADGNLIFQTSTPAGSSSTPQTQATRLTINSTGATFVPTIIGHRPTYTGVVGTTNLDLSTGNAQWFTFGAGNETLTFSNIKNGAVYVITMIQDSGGSRTVTWPASVKWVGASAPTLSTGANAKDFFAFVSDGTNLYELSRALNVH